MDDVYREEMLAKGKQSVNQKGSDPPAKRARSGVRSGLDKEIGARIRSLRESLDLSTRAFARGVPGLRSSNLSEIERGLRRCPSSVLEGLRQRYGVSVDFILSGKKPGEKPRPGVRTRMAPVFNPSEAAIYLLAGDAPSLRLPDPSGGAYVPTTVEDPRSFYIDVESVELSGRLVGMGDRIMVSPGEQIEDGNLVIVGIEHVLYLARYRFLDHDEAVVIHESGVMAGQRPIHLRGREIKNIKMYRIVAILRAL